MTTLTGFDQRTSQYMAAAAKAARAWFDAEGNWIAPTKPLETRECLWLAFALYAQGEPALADAVVRKGDTPFYRDHYYNIFDTNIAALLLFQHRQRMSDDIGAKLQRLTRDGFDFKPGNRQPDYQFHGYNDNMPAKATMGLILGGEMLDCPEAVEYGLWNLRQFRAMLVRRGINSEYNSPTYSSLTIHAMAEITEHSRNEEARELAAGIEQRLWMDLSARFHPELGRDGRSVLACLHRGHAGAREHHGRDAVVLPGRRREPLADGILQPPAGTGRASPGRLPLQHRADVLVRRGDLSHSAARARAVPAEDVSLPRGWPPPSTATAARTSRRASPGSNRCSIPTSPSPPPARPSSAASRR